MLILKAIINILFVLVLWILVFFMAKRKKEPAYKERLAAGAVLKGFSILAIGETMQLIFLRDSQNSLSRAALTLLLLFMLLAFKNHFSIKSNVFHISLIVIGVLSLIAIPSFYNEGNGLLKLGNIMFLILGLGMGLMFIKESFEKYDFLFLRAGILLLIITICSISTAFASLGSGGSLLLFTVKSLSICLMEAIFAKSLFTRYVPKIWKPNILK